MPELQLLRIAPAIILALALAGCGDKGKKPDSAPPAPPPVTVTVLAVEAKRIPVTIEVLGRTEGSREVEVRARASGILERQLFREGEPLKAGAPMYRVDRSPFEIALDQAKAALAQEQARRERAALELQRLQKLLASRVITQREYDDGAANLRQLDAAQQSARAGVRQAELNLSYTTINAPIAGIAGRSLLSEGSLVTAGGDEALLTKQIRTDPIWVRFSLSEAEYARLRAGRGEKSTVSLLRAGDSVAGASGRLNFTGTSIDPRLGTVQLRAEFANPSLALLPGQYVKARVEIGEADSILVPQSSVQQGDRGPFVWVVGADDTVKPRVVQTGEWVGRDWVVSEGLEPGERVAIDNLIRLRPGAKVQPKPAAN